MVLVESVGHLVELGAEVAQHVELEFEHLGHCWELPCAVCLSTIFHILSTLFVLPSDANHTSMSTSSMLLTLGLSAGVHCRGVQECAQRLAPSAVSLGERL